MYIFRTIKRASNAMIVMYKEGCCTILEKAKFIKYEKSS